MAAVAAATDDSVLVQRLRDGDETALVEVMERYGGELMRLLCRLLGDQQAAEEAYQDTLLRLWSRCHVLRMQERLRPWLFRVARNRAIDALRIKHTDRLTKFDYKELLADLPACDFLPDEEAERSRWTSQLECALKRLPVDYRNVLYLLYLRGMRYRQVADQLAIPVGTVKSRTVYALKRMRKLLADAV